MQRTEARSLQLFLVTSIIVSLDVRDTYINSNHDFLMTNFIVKHSPTKFDICLRRTIAILYSFSWVFSLLSCDRM